MQSIIKIHFYIVIFFLTVFSFLFILLVCPSSIIAKMTEICEGDAADLILLFSMSLVFSWMVSESIFKAYQIIFSKRQNTLKLGEILILGGYIKETERDDALHEQSHRMGEILIQAGRITMKQLQQALEVQNDKRMKIGKILRRMKYATKEDIDWALKQAKRKMGQILVDKRLLSFNQLQDALSIQQEFHPIKI